MGLLFINGVFVCVFKNTISIFVTICNIFHAVEGVSKAKSFGAETKKEHIEFKENMQIEIEPTVIESAKPTSSASPALTTGISPQRKEAHFSGDIRHLMQEEKRILSVCSTN